MNNFHIDLKEKLLSIYVKNIQIMNMNKYRYPRDTLLKIQQYSGEWPKLPMLDFRYQLFRKYKINKLIMDISYFLILDIGFRKSTHQSIYFFNIFSFNWYHCFFRTLAVHNFEYKFINTQDNTKYTNISISVFLLKHIF